MSRLFTPHKVAQLFRDAGFDVHKTRRDSFDVYEKLSGQRVFEVDVPRDGRSVLLSTPMVDRIAVNTYPNVLHCALSAIEGEQCRLRRSRDQITAALKV